LVVYKVYKNKEIKKLESVAQQNAIKKVKTFWDKTTAMTGTIDGKNLNDVLTPTWEATLQNKNNLAGIDQECSYNISLINIAEFLALPEFTTDEKAIKLTNLTKIKTFLNGGDAGQKAA